ncbi:sarcosine oxidase subunit gamma [Pararhodobacter oceanensis]|uniref:sarcosine oxidase subunit gamma n=1 Tax=Pararhodobacter oceanensis TaxID=2172121 RepID=UPI003A8FC892
MSYDVQISRQPISAVFDLKGAAAALNTWLGGSFPALPEGANQRVTRDAVGLYHIGRQHWLLRAPIAQEEALQSQLAPERAPSEISIVRISDSLVFFTVTGRDTAEIMSIACPLDLHPSAFDDSAASFTTAFGVKALVNRVSGGFEFGVDVSYADMIADYLARASQQALA